MPPDVLEELKELRRSLREPIRIANELRGRITVIETLSAYDPGRDHDRAIIEHYARGAGVTDSVFPLTEPARPFQATVRAFDAAAWATHVSELQTEAEGLREQLAAIPDPTTLIAAREAELLAWWIPE